MSTKNLLICSLLLLILYLSMKYWLKTFCGSKDETQKPRLKNLYFVIDYIIEFRCDIHIGLLVHRHRIMYFL